MGFDFRERCPVPESSPDAWWLDTLGLKLSFFSKLVLKLSFVFDFSPDVSNYPSIGTAVLSTFICPSVCPSGNNKAVPMHEIFFLIGVFPDLGIFKFYGDKLTCYIVHVHRTVIIITLFLRKNHGFRFYGFE